MVALWCSDKQGADSPDGNSNTIYDDVEQKVKKDNNYYVVTSKQ